MQALLAASAVREADRVAMTARRMLSLRPRASGSSTLLASRSDSAYLIIRIQSMRTLPQWGHRQ